jgi:hypothetical protein
MSAHHPTQPFKLPRGNGRFGVKLRKSRREHILSASYQEADMAGGGRALRNAPGKTPNHCAASIILSTIAPCSLLVLRAPASYAHGGLLLTDLGVQCPLDNEANRVFRV